MTNIETRVKEVIAEKLAVSIEMVTLDANIKKDIGGDSLDVLEIVMTLEEEFSITVPDESIETIHTVQDAITCVQGRAGGKYN